jgi:hypothetical protein
LLIAGDTCLNQGKLFVDETRTLELLIEFLEEEIDQWDEDDEDAYSFEFPETLQIYLESLMD